MKLDLNNKIIPERVLDSLSIPLILGFDFLKFFDMKIDFSTRSWTYNSESEVIYIFEAIKSNLDQCNGIPALTFTQANILKKFLFKYVIKTPEKPGLIDITEHKFEETCQSPIKQRHYTVSSKVMEAIFKEVDETLRDQLFFLVQILTFPSTM